MKVLSFDPAVSKFGWAASTYDPTTGSFTVHRFGTFYPSKVAIKDKVSCEKYGQQLIALYVVEDEIRKLIIEHRPDYVVIEDSFAHRFIQAFVSLKLCKHSAARVCHDHGLVLHALSPKGAKKITAKSGTAGKESVQEAILDNDSIIIEEPRFLSDPLCMNEHEGDAISLGYAFITTYVI